MSERIPIDAQFFLEQIAEHQFVISAPDGMPIGTAVNETWLQSRGIPVPPKPLQPGDRVTFHVVPNVGVAAPARSGAVVAIDGQAVWVREEPSDPAADPYWTLPLSALSRAEDTNG